jgi:excisionase family DNA binding protein
MIPKELWKPVAVHLTIQDLADRSQVAAITVRRWLRDGKAPVHMRIGRIIRFRLEDVEDWEDARSSYTSSEERLADDH